MLPGTFEYLHSLIEEKLVRKNAGQKTISTRKQLMICIWKMATPDSYRSICEKFDVGKATALICVRKVVKALIELAPTIIAWPDEERAVQIWEGFSTAKNFPKVIGCIDGTYIRIPSPHTDHASYINRKGYHSIQLQAVCDHQGKFIHCYVGHPGSVHDQRVFKLSELHNYVNDDSKFPENCHMLGDAAYTLHEHLLTPYKNNGHLTERQKNFNFCHSSIRMAIERALGLLKVRFRSLLTVLDMADIKEIPNFILGCCVLHNICVSQNDQLDVGDILSPEIYEDNEHPLVRQQLAKIKRDAICEELPIVNMEI